MSLALRGVHNSYGSGCEIDSPSFDAPMPSVICRAHRRNSPLFKSGPGMRSRARFVPPPGWRDAGYPGPQRIRMKPRAEPGVSCAELIVQLSTADVAESAYSRARRAQETSGNSLLGVACLFAQSIT